MASGLTAVASGPGRAPAAARGRIPIRTDAVSRLCYSFVRLVLRPVLLCVWRPRVFGAENIPRTGGVILASNHLSFLDSFFLGAVTRRRITFLAKSEYFTTPGRRGWLTRVFFTAVGQLSVDRNNQQKAGAALGSAVQLLSRGELVGIYPEGTRSPDGRLYRARTGVARMALEAGVPVIPVALIGTFQVLPTGRRLPRLRPVDIRFGAPLDLRQHGKTPDAQAARAAADEVMAAIQSLSGQPYAPTDARRFKTEAGLGRSR
ncbi:lysophospholipid acyltransferase family protein [Frankia nepalensis]|uniref:lysophospholipid acyltransferase family protein n=1 Tax=Frankia nepalensis TaxID=1836974 RepID=UPI002889B9BE|nr:lysophospholipid acyltransferase family protein [Frankia nepalensis]